MSNPLAHALLAVVDESIGWIIECVEGLDAKGLNWTPSEGTNSLHVIANYTMANAERNVLASYCGLPYTYDRAAEFTAQADDAATPLGERWEHLRSRLAEHVAAAGPEAFDRDCDHVRMGRVKGWKVLVQVSRHAAEHVGEARLTRQLFDATHRPKPGA